MACTRMRIHPSRKYLKEYFCSFFLSIGFKLNSSSTTGNPIQQSHCHRHSIEPLAKESKRSLCWFSLKWRERAPEHNAHAYVLLKCAPAIKL